MDWNLPSSQKQSTVVIALAKLPAGVAPDDPRYGGPILLNPGGPGGSGVDLVLSSGRKIQRQVNPNHDKKHRPGSRFYDILGFDPRGVNNTTPTMSCFSNAPSFRRWKTQLQAFGLPGSSNTSFMQAWAANSALSETCSRVYSSSSLGQHINTVPVARDMLEIVKQHADWSIRQGHEPNGLATDSKLRYIGYSYGTVLATVFASLWPMHVGKMVLDGVVDTMDYYAGHWFEAIGDADQVPAHFAEACAEAGSACAFFDKPNYVKPSTIFERFRQTLDGLLENPLAVSSSTDHDPDVITFSDFINYLRDWSYGFSSLSNLTATFLRDIAAGNGSSFATYKQNALDTSLLHQNFEEAKMAIECSDMPVLNITAGEYSKHYWNVYRKQSWFLGDRVSVVRMMCNNWRLRPKWQFDSSFSKIMEVSPVLLVSNTFDPVTPVRKYVLNCSVLLRLLIVVIVLVNWQHNSRKQGF